MRFVVDDVGRPITEFPSTRTLTKGMRDAIRGTTRLCTGFVQEPYCGIVGHKQAWEKARVLHKDVSDGNILLSDNPLGNTFEGFLHDFDYSAMEDLAELLGDDEGIDDTADKANKSEAHQSQKERTVSRRIVNPRCCRPISDTFGREHTTTGLSPFWTPMPDLSCTHHAMTLIL